MSSSSRPGGLTVLAVLNLIGGVILALLNIGPAIWLYPKLGQDPADIEPKELQPAIEAIHDLGDNLWLTLIGIVVVAGTCMFISGIGFLKQKKVMGRGLGNAYAILSLGSKVPTLMGMGVPEDGSSGGILMILMLIYPVLTLYLINFTFKEDFVN